MHSKDGTDDRYAVYVHITDPYCVTVVYSTLHSTYLHTRLIEQGILVSPVLGCFDPQLAMRRRHPPQQDNNTLGWMMHAQNSSDQISKEKSQYSVIAFLSTQYEPPDDIPGFTQQ